MDKLVNPKLFQMVIQTSRGGSFRIQTTSPKSFTIMTKDTFNHPLWNPKSTVVDDQEGQLAKFDKRFGSGFDFLTTGDAIGVVLDKKPVIAKPVVQETKKGKKK